MLLYTTAQIRLILINKSPLFNKRTRANILWIFSVKMTTSAEVLLIWVMLLVAMLMLAYCRQGESLMPFPTIMTGLWCSFCMSMTHFSFIKVLNYGCWHSRGMLRHWHIDSIAWGEVSVKIWISIFYFLSLFIAS